MKVKEYLKSIHSVVNRLALVAVITVFCGIFVFPLFYSGKDVKATKAEIAAIGAALEKYHAETGKWPSAGARSVAAALSGEGFSSHARRDPEGRFLDPWETPYRFYFSQDSFVIQSAGSDEKFVEGLAGKGDDYWFTPR